MIKILGFEGKLSFEPDVEKNSSGEEIVFFQFFFSMKVYK
jgi:hypothetical protein